MTIPAPGEPTPIDPDPQPVEPDVPGSPPGPADSDGWDPVGDAVDAGVTDTGKEIPVPGIPTKAAISIEVTQWQALVPGERAPLQTFMQPGSSRSSPQRPRSSPTVRFLA